MRLAGNGVGSRDRAPRLRRHLFDQHAEDFDEILVARLGYDVPALARTWSVRPAGAVPHARPRLRHRARRRRHSQTSRRRSPASTSPKASWRQRRRGVYSGLYVGEAVTFLAGWDEEPFALVVATDVWPYLGDLAPFAAAAALCLRPGGSLVASSERGTADFAVTATQRFCPRHPRTRPASLTAAGFAVAAVGGHHRARTRRACRWPATGARPYRARSGARATPILRWRPSLRRSRPTDANVRKAEPVDGIMTNSLAHSFRSGSPPDRTAR